jgi:branched-chain amino acid transport system substrate-binding protein
MRDVVAAWAKSVNARGGIAGHPVTPLFGDDGGDESKSVALVRDFVENKGAIAILAYSSGTANGVGNYAQSKNIPMIGGASVEPIWQTNPVMFATGGGPSGRYYGVARRAKDAGIDKVATMYCTEVAACSDFNSKFVEHAHALGLNVVYQARVSLAQPDYTAECLQARNNGAQAIVPMADTNTTIRIAQSCARQDYHPKFVLALANDGLAKVPELNGALVSLTDFPWFLYSGTPALDEYGTALKTYAPHLLDGQNADFGSMGWAAGKLFEAAARNVSDNPSSQEILDGLWSLNGEQLGGLTPPLTYVRDQPTPEIFCTFQVELKDAQWVANNGVNYVCR